MSKTFLSPVAISRERGFDPHLELCLWNGSNSFDIPSHVVGN